MPGSTERAAGGDGAASSAAPVSGSSVQGVSRPAASGVWLRVEPDGGTPLLLPLGRDACGRLAEAVILSADPDALVCRTLDAARAPEAGLAAVIAEEGAGPFLARFPVGRAGDGVPFPDASIALWLWSRDRRRQASAAAGSSDGAGLAGEIVAPEAIGGAVEVPPAEWFEWLRAEGDCGGDLATATAARWERLVRGDRPASGGGTPAPPGSEGRTLLAAARLADAHRAAAGRFAERLAAARIEAIRELAYGAGHEINNPLANIATRAQTLLADERDPERRRRLSVIVDQAFRARDLIGGLMLFARPPRPQPARVDPDALVASAVEGTAALAAARKVRVTHRSATVPLGAWVDRSMVVEALRAVVANGIEAVAEGGSVAIEVQGPMPAPPGAGDARRRCRIVVVDDGRGMDAATVRRAFDPFFSGREAGRGVGLGLSKAWRFVEANDGSLALESRPGGGTRVTFTLPLAPD